VISPQYESANFFVEGIALVKSNGYYGYIDSLNNFVITPKYLKAFDFRYDRAKVEDLDSIFIIDKNQRVIFSAKKGGLIVEDFWYGYAKILKGDSFNILSINGNILFKTWFEQIGFYSENGTFPVKKDGKWGIVDTLERYVICPTFDYIDRFNDGYAIVKLGEKYSFINQQGETVVPFLYESASFFKDGLASVSLRKGKKISYGVIDTTFKFITKPKYKYIGDYYFGRAVCQKGLKYGYLDKQGRVAIKFKYDYASNFFDNLSIVKIKNDNYVINSFGQLLVGPNKELYILNKSMENTILCIYEGSLISFLFKNKCENRFVYRTTSGRVIWGNVSE
jgi:hypothetical protein